MTHLLLVEDDDDIRETLHSVLEHRGLRVIAARNGREAIEMVRASGTRPSLILLDLLMPVMDGEAFLEAQQSDPLLAHVPVIVTTAQLSRPAVMPPTVKTVFTKPVALVDLLEAIELTCHDLPPMPVAFAKGTGRLPES
jgi:two-component system response regulator MprA